MMTRTGLVRVALLGVALLTLAACAAGPNNVATVNAPHIAGFCSACGMA
jgi:hypothetical protein